ncbi:hypothetical protein IFR04_002379 [Cadophora malorum]|uniref:Cyclase n=1 Tax=Cadophora malorum TaxID=108018 RepID=A0A8H7WGW0_9HELO|nr:hypothetical protein IFR04_002379 [Cadophora malorum]
MHGPLEVEQPSNITSEKVSDVPRYDPSIYSTPFSQLPNPKRVWLGSPSSSLEGLGRLSLLTPEVVSAAAASEIKTGRRVGLGWDMTKLEYSQFGRQKCGHTIIPLLVPGGPGLGACFDDAYSMNPQQSSQWDGFRHYSQPRDPKGPSNTPDRVFYGGTTKEEIMDISNHRIGLQHWASEGIAGRGILLDYQLWAASQSPPITYTNFSTHAIPFTAILAMCKTFNVTPQKGDVLFIRMGVIPEWDQYTSTQKQDYAAQKEPEHAGVEACIEVLEWLWNSGISAVAGDAISWEVYPTPGAISVHEYLLAGWGMPIGELFDLEALSKTCQELNRYSFFITSMPLNMPGGVSSPPNAMAIF